MKECLIKLSVVLKVGYFYYATTLLVVYETTKALNNLVRKWPVFVHYDFKIDMAELMQIIISLEAEAGMEVLSACCDQG